LFIKGKSVADVPLGRSRSPAAHGLKS